MRRFFAVLAIAVGLTYLGAPGEAQAQSSGAPTGCSTVGCNPYFNTYFPPSLWPVMSWLDTYAPNVSPPGQGCIPGAPVIACVRGQGVVVSRFNPGISYSVMSLQISIPETDGSGAFMAAALTTGGAPPDYTQTAGVWPGNQLYPASAYALDCGQDPAYLMASWTPSSTAYACKMTNAPIMDMSEIQTKLENQGYVWYLSYPFRDSGSGHAVVSYAKYGVACGPATIPPPAWWSIPQASPTRTYSNLTTGESGPWPCMQGYARVTNAGWVNQFTDSGAVCSGYGYNAQGAYGCLYTNYSYGDYIGEYFATLPASAQVNAIRVIASRGAAVWISWGPAPAAGAYLVPVIDEWLGELTAPPLPQVPTFVTQSAKTVDVGQSGTSSGTGTAGAASAPSEGSGTFNYEAFCSAPDVNGRTRSSAWIKNCLANVDRH